MHSYMVTNGEPATLRNGTPDCKTWRRLQPSEGGEYQLREDPQLAVLRTQHVFPERETYQSLFLRCKDRAHCPRQESIR